MQNQNQQPQQSESPVNKFAEIQTALKEIADSKSTEAEPKNFEKEFKAAAKQYFSNPNNDINFNIFIIS